MRFFIGKDVPSFWITVRVLPVPLAQALLILCNSKMFLRIV